MEHPASVGKYDLEEYLGGGMSRVYRAKDRLIGRTVCIKILTSQGTADPEVRDRFLQEARVAGNFCHDNVVAIYDFGEDDGNPFLVMEYLRGDSLRTLINEKKLDGLNDILQIALQLARALECVHAQNIIHRDVKPENVHVTGQRVVKLMDFGIAKARGLNMTQAGFILGTPYYMAPEQIRGEEITSAIDIYAFGVLLYELLAGQKPFRAETPEAIFYAILNTPADMGPLQQERVPEPIQQLVMRCMSKAADDRPQSFTEIVGILEGYINSLSGATIARATPTDLREQSGGAGAAEPVIKPRTSPVWYVVAGAAILIAAGAVFFAVRSRSGGPLPKAVASPAGDMVLVPEGDFLYGPDRKTRHLKAFYIDKTEVTNGAWSEFCKATGCTAPPGDGALPIADVSINEAREFARWAGKRLPSAEEWEKAARGTDGREFPWGNDENLQDANLGSSAPVSVMAHPEGASPYGALQMAGNVSEIVGSAARATPELVDQFSKVLTPPPTPYEPWIMIRGGSFRNKKLDAARTYEFSRIPARFTHSDIGFRCAKDATP